MLTLPSEEYIPWWQHLICDLRQARPKVNHCPANEPDLTCTALDIIACFSRCLQIRTVQQTWLSATADNQRFEIIHLSLCSEKEKKTWYFWVTILPRVCQCTPVHLTKMIKKWFEYMEGATHLFSSFQNDTVFVVVTSCRFFSFQMYYIDYFLY